MPVILLLAQSYHYGDCHNRKVQNIGTVLDPITGLPLIASADDNLEQIPLGTQVIDWTGLKATDRPRRQSAYPDDVLPTIGLVQGMYNDAAQVVDTDGNNNLKVYVVNESGGGGGGGGGLSPMVAIDGGAYVNFDISSGVTNIAKLSTDAGDYLLGAHFAVSVSGSGLSTASFKLAQLVLTDGTNLIRIASFSFWFTAGGTPPTPPYQSTMIWYPIPLNLAEMFSVPVNDVDIKVFAGSWALNAGIYIITGNPQT